MKLLRHPNIIDVHDVIDDGKKILIITEYASGGELFDYIVQHGRVKEREATVFFRQVLSAIDYCHQVNISSYK